MKIYIAGSDVFYNDAKSRIADYSNICLRYGHIPLTPLDNEIDQFDPKGASLIYRANIKSILDCDVVIANVNNFRGLEPDSGTAFEIGFAAALNKIIIMWYNTDCGKDLISRLGTRYIGDTIVEDFGLPLNIMLALSGDYIQGNFEDAISLL